MISKKRMIAFAIACCLLLLPGCVEDKPLPDTGSESATQAEETTADSKKEITVKLTDMYEYSLPGDAEESFVFEKSEGFTDERFFLLNDGDTVVRSFIITDEPDCFPGLVEYLLSDLDAEISYSDFFDTTLATAVDTGQDEDGNACYRKSYFWPSGRSTLCCISIETRSEDDLETAGSILSTVKKNGDSAHYDWEIPPNAEQYLHPSQEEIDQAMMQEAQEAIQHQYEQDEQYYDYDSSLGKRGR